MWLHSRFVLAGCLFCQLVSLRAAEADPISQATAPSFRLLATGAPVTARFAGSDAAFDSELHLASPVEQGPLFHNRTTVPGHLASLGPFPSGTELIFRLHVITTNEDFFTGPGARNPDGVPHARATIWTSLDPQGVLVGFEDLFGGGDNDFNDFEFVLTGVRLEEAAPVPEPATLLLALAGAVAVGRYAKKPRHPRNFVA